jgi:hypothetical protein
MTDDIGSCSARMNTTAQALFISILACLPNRHMAQSLEALMHTILAANGNPRPQHVIGKSASAISRFLNEYVFNLSPIIEITRATIEKRLKEKYHKRPGRKKKLNIIIDLTTLEKTGKFPGLPLSVFNKTWGLHIVVLYLELGDETYVWSFLAWKGKNRGGTPAQLALQQIRALPAWMQETFETQVLVDGGFTSSEFIEGCDWLNYPVVGTVASSRTTTDGRKVSEICDKGECVMLNNCSVKVYVSWFRFKCSDNSYETRYVISTRKLNGEYIAQIGRKRWKIEGFFKVMKSRFGMDQFGQRTFKGVIRFICFTLLAYVLSSLDKVVDKKGFVDWQATSHRIQGKLTPWVVCEKIAKAISQLAENLGLPIEELFIQLKQRKHLFKSLSPPMA